MSFRRRERLGTQITREPTDAPTSKRDDGDGELRGFQSGTNTEQRPFTTFRIGKAVLKVP
jgi:hypothetical protein